MTIQQMNRFGPTKTLAAVKVDRTFSQMYHTTFHGIFESSVVELTAGWAAERIMRVTGIFERLHSEVIRGNESHTVAVFDFLGLRDFSIERFETKMWAESAFQCITLDKRLLTRPCGDSLCSFG